MAPKNNQVVVFVTISSFLFALSAQAQLVSFISTAPEAAPAPVSTFEPLDVKSDITPLDVQAHVSQFIKTNMIAGKSKAEQYLKGIEKRMKDPSTSSAAGQCLKECQEVYNAAVDDMKNTIDDMDSGDYYKASMDISAVWNNVDTCRECYKEMVGNDPEANKFDEWVLGITNDCLDKLEKVTS